METISLKLDGSLLEAIDSTLSRNRYSTRTEFIREAIRDKIRDIEKENALLRLENMYGAGKKRGRITTDEDIHKAGEKAVKQIAKRLGVKL